LDSKKFICKKCKMKFSNEERLSRHKEKAHPNKRKFVNPDQYWHDAGAGA